MLNRTEREVVRATLSFCGERESCLLTVGHLRSLTDIRKMSESKLLTIMDSLAADGYFDVIRCKKGDEDALCVTPKIKARAYKSELKRFLRDLWLKILIAVAGSLTAFAVTRLLYKLF